MFRTSVHFLRNVFVHPSRGLRVTRGLSVGATSSGGVDEPPDTEWTVRVPDYQERHGESTEVKRARLLYQSRKRGMLENGLLLSTFAARYLNRFTESELDTYDLLINKPSNDWDIYHWITGKSAVPSEYQSSVMDLLIEHTKNNDKEVRLQQPALYDN